MFEIPVVSVTCDGAKANRKFYRMCAAELKKQAESLPERKKGKSDFIPYKSANPYREGAQVYFFCDAPHLLKTARNCFSNSFAHSKSRNMQVFVYLANYASLILLYLTEKWPGNIMDMD